MVRFVESDELGVAPKRKQVSNACGSCRKRKKRCVHHDTLPPGRQESDVLESEVDEPLSRPPPPPLHATANTPRTTSPTLPRVTAPTPTTTPLGPPLRPASIRTPASAVSHSPAHTSSTEENDTLKARFVGDTNVEGLLVEAVSPRSKRDSSNRGGVGIWISPSTPAEPPSAMTLAHKGLESVILPYVRDVCLKVVPPRRDFARLRKIYLDKIHPIFPVLDAQSLGQDADESLPSTILSRQVMSLAAGTDKEATNHLRFEPGSPPLPHAEFATTLTSAIRAAIDSGIISDRLVLVRCLSLLSLYIHPPSAEETDLPAMVAARAIHHGHTMAVQIKGKTDEEEREMERVFLCLWTVDRLNATFYGRPCVMHERDFSRSIDDAIDKQAPAFRLFLTVIKFLDEVIMLYRPCAPSCDFFNLSALEEVIIRTGAARIPSALLATIETFYNAVIILSCRMPSPGRDGRGGVPIPAASCRRSLAAERITFVVGKEFKGRLSPLPIVPYSVSLALSVAYRKMRYTRVPMYYTRSRHFFATNCNLLRSLGDLFWSAKVLASLGDRVLREMEKAMSSIAMDQSGAGVAGNASGDSERTMVGAEGQAACTTDAATQAGSDASGAAMGVGDAPAAAAATTNGAGTLMEPANPEASFFDILPDMDLFGHLDPGFNIDAVDAALEANLDPGLQVHWPDWGDWGLK